MLRYTFFCGILVVFFISLKSCANAACSTNPETLTTRPGDVFLECTCTGVTAATYVIQWCLERTCASPLAVGANYNTINNILDAATVQNTLTVISAQIDDTATYYCQGDGSIVAETELTIVDVPEARIMPRSASITNGENTTLECILLNSDGNIVNEPVVWRKNGEDIKEDLDGDGQVDIRLTGSELIIIDGNSSDGGSYSCGQYNRSLPVEDTLPLQTPVHLSTNIITLAEDKNGKVTSAQLECVAEGYPLASFEWNDGDTNANIKESNNTLFSRATSSLFADVSFVYQCTANNGVGEPVTANLTFGSAENCYDENDSSELTCPEDLKSSSNTYCCGGSGKYYCCNYDDYEAENDDSLSTGEKVAIGICVFVFIAIIIVLIVSYVKGWLCWANSGQ